MLGLSKGEFIFIALFCITYGLIANVQSRLFPIEKSMAYNVRKKVSFEVDRLTDRHYCEDQALKGGGRLIWVWYENQKSYEYWCGLLDPDTLTEQRISELAPYITILNSSSNIKRVTGQ